MKRWVLLIPLLMVVALVSQARSWTINGFAPGSTASATPVPVGSTTPVPVVTCATSLYSGNSNPATLYIDFSVTGGTVGTDGCYVMPATTASPCAAASPVPSVSLVRGYFLPTGGVGWTHTAINWPAAGGGAILSSEWDAVCSAGSMKISTTTLP